MAYRLTKGLNAEHLIASEGHDSEAIIEQAKIQVMKAQIPPRTNRKVLRECDKHLYRQWLLVENTFPHIKQWRSVATRYAMN